MRRFALAVILLLGTLPVVVRADTLRTFSLDGSNSEGHLGGVVTIDTTTGIPLTGSIDFVYAASGTPFADPSQSLHMHLSGQFTSGSCNDCLNYPNTRSFSIGPSNSDGSSLSSVLSTPTSLVNYMGGPLCFRPGCDPEAFTTFLFSNVPYPPGTFNGVQYPAGTLGGGESFFNANLTLVSEVVTPEPATWMLIGTGLLGLGCAVKRELSSRCKGKKRPPCWFTAAFAIVWARGASALVLMENTVALATSRPDEQEHILSGWNCVNGIDSLLC